jgi:IrrE N-terminal-like domain
MALRRGFKTEANWYAARLREELNIAVHLPLCPWRLAAHLGFPVAPLSDYAKDEPEAVGYLQSKSGQKDFSAVTLAVGRERIIIHNDAHDPKRQAANISHELAHGLLNHPPMKILDPSGKRAYVWRQRTFGADAVKRHRCLSAPREPAALCLRVRDTKRRGPRPLMGLRNRRRYRLSWYKGSGKKSILRALLSLTSPAKFSRAKALRNSALSRLTDSKVTGAGNRVAEREEPESNLLRFAKRASARKAAASAKKGQLQRAAMATAAFKSPSATELLSNPAPPTA